MINAINQNNASSPSPSITLKPAKTTVITTNCEDDKEFLFTADAFLVFAFTIIVKKLFYCYLQLSLQ